MTDTAHHHASPAPTDPPTTQVPQPRTCPFSPPDGYQQLRDDAPLSRVRLPSGKTAWAVARHGDIRAMLTDPRFSSDRRNPGFPFTRADSAKPGPVLGRPSMIAMDPPEHTAARRRVISEFTVRRMQALRPRIQQIVDTHIDAMLAGPRTADLVQALALPVPSLVICEQLGVPYSDHEFFQSRSKQIISRVTPMEQVRSGAMEIQSYLDELIASKEADPPDDLLGRQIRKQREEGGGDREDLVSLAFLLLIAGHETTANMISLGTVALLEHPDQLALVRDDPALTPGAVEELLRYFTIAEFANSRVATSDVELGGTLVKEGEGVLALSSAANWEPGVFADPGGLDVTRPARHHLAFGYGPHQCLGQNLARMELQIVFDTLFRRVPTLSLAAGIDELPFKDDSNIYGLHELPVTWQAEGPS